MNRGDYLKKHEEEIQQYIEDNPMVVMINQPSNVTVKTSEGKYLKKPQIGEEHFEVCSCYTGKRGSFIFVFKPVDPETGKSITLQAGFSFMEMKTDEAYERLDGFRDYIKTALNRDVEMEHKKKLQIENDEKEEKRFKKSSESYGDNYGSW